jgi:hypothetical protein
MKLTQTKINRLRSKLKKLRRKGDVRSSELEAIAKACGRTRDKRGSESTWVNLDHRGLRPLSIPHHSKELNRFTSGSILDQLEADLDYLENLFYELDDGEDEQ